MDSLKKVVWAEGIFLSQQHFQAWERYQDSHHAVRQRILSPFSWGVIELDIDEISLRLGSLNIRKLKVIFPDGRLVAFDSTNNGVLNLDLTQLSKDRNEIYLGLPTNNSVAGISGYQSQGLLNAWQTEFREIPDEHDPTRVREVMLANPNLKLLTDEESHDQFVTIKIAKVVRASDKEFILDDDFVPPCVMLASDKRLHKRIKEISQLISARVSQSVDAAKQVSNLFEYNQQDIIRLLRNQILAKALIKLKHLVRYPENHPYQYFEVLANTTAELAPIEKPEEVLSIPDYQHGNLLPPINQLEATIRSLLKEVVRASSATVKLIKEFDGLYKASGLTKDKLTKENFYLAVYHESADPAWVSEFSGQAKIGASEHIEMIVASALTGVRLIHTQRPPNSLSVKSGYEYFRLEGTGDYWQKIVETESLSVFLPYGFQNASVELVSVED
jgi:type VI secretion system protein ImpJ